MSTAEVGSTKFFMSSGYMALASPVASSRTICRAPSGRARCAVSISSCFRRPRLSSSPFLRGEILDVAVDVRRGSPTFGKYVSTEVSSESGRQVYIPIGFAHGFLTLEDDVIVMYKTSAYYAPAHDSGIRWNDPDVAFPWPLNEADIVTSQKDQRLPFLKEFASTFKYDGYPLGHFNVT